MEGEKSASRLPPESATIGRWNESRINMYRFFVTLYSFVVMGMNDGAVGVSRTRLPSWRANKEIR